MNSRMPTTLRIRRATLYGAAAGMAAGFLFQTVTTVVPGREIALWRNFIIAGAIVGFAIGVIAKLAGRGQDDTPDG